MNLYEHIITLIMSLIMYYNNIILVYLELWINAQTVLTDVTPASDFFLKRLNLPGAKRKFSITTTRRHDGETDDTTHFTHDDDAMFDGETDDETHFTRRRLTKVLHESLTQVNKSLTRQRRLDALHTTTTQHKSLPTTHKNFGSTRIQGTGFHRRFHRRIWNGKII